jgi:heme oxygenase (biliverdin-producing, ferredoxin)
VLLANLITTTVLKVIYSFLKSLLEKHRDNPILAAFYDISILSRSDCLSHDINHILNGLRRKDYPLLSPEMTKALAAYLRRLTDLDQTSPGLLLAHIYVRILGDLNGGQLIKRRVQKAYQLEEESLTFYRFGLSAEDVKLAKLRFKDILNRVVDENGFLIKGTFLG